MKKLKRTLFCALLFLFFPPLSACVKGELKEIERPWLGVYECERICLGERELTEDYKILRLELNKEGSYLLTAQPKSGGERIKAEGQYTFDFETSTLRFYSVADGEEKSLVCPLEKGRITVLTDLDGQTLVAFFFRP